MGSNPVNCLITVRGRLEEHWSPWLEGLALSYRKDGAGQEVTDLVGILADQSALHGVLHRIWNMNLSVLSVNTSLDAGGAKATPDRGDIQDPG
jgi:hypothetical protein